MSLPDRIAVFGLGRSGLNVARAAQRRGIDALVVDEASADLLPKPELLEEARTQWIDVQLQWSGALPNGVQAVVVNPAVAQTHPALVACQRVGIEIWSEIEFAYRISRAPIVAITGTNGKSTSTVMTWLALEAAGQRPILCGNVYGSGYPEMTLTEAADTAEPNQVLVAEVSSFQLEWVHRFRPVAAAITNITPDHLNRYPSFDAYAATKLRIFAAQTAEDFAIVRAHDPVVFADSVESTVSSTLLRFGRDAEDADVTADTIRFWGEAFPLSEFPFRESHNALNAALAALVAYGLLKSRAAADPSGPAAAMLETARQRRLAGVRPTIYGQLQPENRGMPLEILEGLRNFRGLAHRMQEVGVRNGIRVINNSMSTNPDAVLKSAQSLRGASHLLMGGLNKGLDFQPLREYLSRSPHRVYLFGSDAASLNSMLGGRWPVFTTMEEAFYAAIRNADVDETVMLAPGCASNDQFRDFRERGDVFTEIARRWLSLK